MIRESLLKLVVFCSLGKFRESLYQLLCTVKVSKFLEHDLA